MNGNQGNVPSIAQLGQYDLTLPNWEAITQSLYDRVTYAAAGQTSLSFFATPNGSGGKTLSDTNLQLSGQLAANNQMLIQSLELRFCYTTPTVAANMPAAFGAQAVAAQVNDTYIFYRAGNLQLVIGDKPYLREAPLGKFPPKTNFRVDAALADVSTAGASFQSRIANAFIDGRPYLLKAPLRLGENQGFTLTLNWPEGVQAITNPATVQCVLDGIFYRKSQ